MTDWSLVRDEFPVLKEFAYLNSGTYGPLLKLSSDVAHKALERDLYCGRGSYPDYLSRVADARYAVRQKLSQIIGAKESEIALSNSTTMAVNVIVRGLKICSNDEIITTNSEHPAFLGVFEATGAAIKKIDVIGKSDSDIVTEFANSITNNTKLIAVSDVSANIGQLLPVNDISKFNVPLLLDSAQSVGSIPIDVNSLNCDFMVFSGHKWLLGLEGTGALYVNAKWFGRLEVGLPCLWGKQPNGGFYDIFFEDAQRYESTSMSLPLLEAWDKALEYSMGLGVERYGRAINMARIFRNEIEAHFNVVTPVNSGNLITFEVKGDQKAITSRLLDQGVVVRYNAYKPWLRLSIGFWNSEADLGRLLHFL
jgi:selenocysteine lyase/cysteine desulfurase